MVAVNSKKKHALGSSLVYAQSVHLNSNVCKLVGFTSRGRPSGTDLYRKAFPHVEKLFAISKQYSICKGR